MLTDIAIRNLKPRAQRYEKPDGHSLYVAVQPSGKKSFVVRFRFNGEPRKLTLAKGLTLAEARAAAAAAIVDVHCGTDPTAAKRKAKEAKEAKEAAAADTLRAVAENFFRREGKNLRSREYQRRILERHVYPAIGDAPVGTIKRKAIVALLDKIEDNSGATAAHMTLAVVRRVLSWHAARDDEYSSPIVRGMGRIKPSEHKRSRILADHELQAVWKAAEQRADPFGALIKFLLLTAARRTEARELRWDEI